MLCAVEECGLPKVKSPYCEMHRARVRRHGSPHTKLTGHGKPCVVDGCIRPPKYRIKTDHPLCPMHYARWRRVGDWRDSAVKQYRGKSHIDDNGYRRIWRDGRQIGEHRWVMEQALGRKLYRDETVHHRNGVRIDNRIENLELWSKNHPAGQRVVDKIEWAKEILARYEGTYPLRDA